MLDFVVLDLDEPFFLVLEVVFGSEGPLELVKAGVSSIPEDNRLVRLADICESASHVLVFDFDGVPSVEGEVSIVALFGDEVDGLIETVREVVLDFRLGCL